MSTMNLLLTLLKLIFQTNLFRANHFQTAKQLNFPQKKNYPVFSKYYAVLLFVVNKILRVRITHNFHKTRISSAENNYYVRRTKFACKQSRGKGLG